MGWPWDLVILCWCCWDLPAIRGHASGTSISPSTLGSQWCHASKQNCHACRNGGFRGSWVSVLLVDYFCEMLEEGNPVPVQLGEESLLLVLPLMAELMPPPFRLAMVWNRDGWVLTFVYFWKKIFATAGLLFLTCFHWLFSSNWPCVTATPPFLGTHQNPISDHDMATCWADLRGRSCPNLLHPLSLLTQSKSPWPGHPLFPSFSPAQPMVLSIKPQYIKTQ